MCTYITFGNYNKLYKYIWLYIIIRILEYLLTNNFLKKTIKIDYLQDEPFPKNILIQKTLNFIGTTIFAMFLWKYELRQNKRSRNNIIPIISSNSKSSSLTFIYNEQKNNLKVVSTIFFFSIIFLYFLSNQLIYIFNSINLTGLDFWMLEIIFICFISVNIFKVSIYKHKKVAIFIVLLFSTTLKAISTVYIIIKEKKEKLYKDYFWIIPIGIISFLLLIFLRGYSYCRLKWLFDLKYISEIKLLLFYGIISSIICLIGCIISSNIKCIDEEDFKGITYICRVSNNNNTYYDHFQKYFKDIWKDKREIWINIIYVILLLIKIFLSFLVNLFSLLIIKYLSPEYLICSYYAFYCIIDLIKLCFEEFDYSNLFEFLAQVLAIIGALIYLEFIELNFCKLNFNLKKNITKRSLLEINLNSTDYSIMDNDNDNDFETTHN